MRFFSPKLLDTLQGYNGALLSKDILAGITVGIVALPLAMAFAIASGLKPEAGIFTAIIAGGLISVLGGSRVQIGGPAGAFIVIVYGIVEHYGVANLLLATVMSGVFLFLMGLFRLGTLIRFIPIAVIIGFTNGIAVLIALSQVKEFFVVNHEPRSSISFKGSDGVDLKVPQKGRIEFDIDIKASPVIPQKVTFYVEDASGKVVAKRVTDQVVEQMRLGFRTNILPNGKYTIYYTAETPFNGQMIAAVSNKEVLTTRN